MNIHHTWWAIWGVGMFFAILGIWTDIDIFTILAVLFIGGLVAWDIAARHSR